MNRNIDENINTLTSHLFREHYGKMVSYLSQKYGYHEIENILDAVQESFETALKTWKFSKIPNDHFAWLYKVASNKLLNKIKQSGTAKTHINHLSAHTGNFEEYNAKEVEDSLLKLLIFFSKADFPERNKLIISLYFLCGFGYSEIARAMFLKSEAVKKIILRSKKTIKEFAGKYDDFRIESIDDNLEHLLKIIYLMFNEGYKSSLRNGAINSDLCYESIRLGKLINGHIAGKAEVNSLLALFFFNVSRFPARIKNDMWISLENQDRTLWDKNLISEGFYYLKEAKDNAQKLNKYYLEAMISSLHCTAENYGSTDWKTISFLYRQLEMAEPGSITLKLNRIIAESNFGKAENLIEEINSIENISDEEVLFSIFTTKAHLYFKRKDYNEAIKSYIESLNHTKNKMDRNYINEKIKMIKKITV